VDTTPPVSDGPRRHQSRQRERLLAYLRAARCHPTAAQIHSALLPHIPALGLATVYRNLEVLVAQGLVAEVPSASGALRYDGNREPHDHFECEACGRILDVPSDEQDRIVKRLAKRFGLQARRVQISFVGLCPPCDNKQRPQCKHRQPFRNPQSRTVKEG
jgi:Fur family transcriptional regulator, peroxide stress response regulator